MALPMIDKQTNLTDSNSTKNSSNGQYHWSSQCLSSSMVWKGPQQSKEEERSDVNITTPASQGLFMNVVTSRPWSFIRSTLFDDHSLFQSAQRIVRAVLNRSLVWRFYDWLFR